MKDDLHPLPDDIHRENSAVKSNFFLSRLDLVLLIAVLVFYAVTRLYGIEEFPIYFFCDEAQQANQASRLVDNGLRDENGNLFPAYFQNVRVYNLGFSVWVHALPVATLGKSIAVVRGTSVAIGLLGVVALMLALKWFFRVRMWWAGGLVMAGFPAWFLHSRTAFETVMMVGFYAVFVLAYLLYREASPRWLPFAVICGAATFYSYSNGQGVMFITCLLLLVTDWKYHWQVLRTDRWAVAAGLLTIILVAIPYLRFRFVLHPEMMEAHLVDVETYWLNDIPLTEKVSTFASIYFKGLSPAYWFTEDVKEIVRHRMLGYPHLPLWLAPMIALGFVLSLWRFRRSPAARLVIIAILAAPFSASIVDIRITRVLSMVVPAAILAVLGFDKLGVWLSRKLSVAAYGAAVGLLLVTTGVTMAGDALINGPLWFRNYGMHGMQWGARQLFSEVRYRLEHAPEATLTISHYWANNPDTLAEFFLDQPLLDRVRSGVIDDLLFERKPLVNARNPFVLTPEEYGQAKASPKLEMGDSRATIPFPDGTPGFFITRLSYSDKADSIFEAERSSRRRLIESTVEIGGGAATLQHPQLDKGEINHAFDGDLRSLARTLDANPARLEFVFSSPRPVAAVRLHLWTSRYTVDVTARRSDGTEFRVSTTAKGSEFDTPVIVDFSQPIGNVKDLTIEIRRVGDVHIHLREIEILP